MTNNTETERAAALVAAAEAMGTMHGKNAASWYFADGTDHAKVLQGIIDGDPEIENMFPCSDLSGEWADGYTVTRLYEDIGLTDEEREACEIDGDDTYITVYEESFDQAAHDEIERVCRYHVEPIR